MIGPELGFTHPGSTIVCGDSHTSTHGAFGALAFGIGTSEVGHVLATQCLLQRKPKSLAVEFEGALSARCVRQGPDPRAHRPDRHRRGHRPRDRVPGIRDPRPLDGGADDGCNMSIEAGARAGLVAPDETTYTYLDGRPAPAGSGLDAAVARWRTLPSDEDAAFDRVERIDAASLEPMITWGTSPGMGIPVRGTVPGPNGDAGLEKALRYMGLEPGKPLLGRKIDVVFIGSCTNSRALRPARGGPGLPRPEGGGRRTRARGARVAGDQEAGRKPRASTGCSAIPGRSGAKPAARCASP